MPIGVHVDHQHGLVTGFAIDKGVDLCFDIREDSKVVLDSETFTGHVRWQGTGLTRSDTRTGIRVSV